MPDNARTHHELAPVLREMYTGPQIHIILSTVRWRSMVSHRELEHRIENAARWYKPYRRLLDQELQPSRRERRWKVLLHGLHDTAAAVRNLSALERDYLKAAGHDLAKRDGRLLDVQPEAIQLPPIPEGTEEEFKELWLPGLQIEACLERLDWLIRCVERAIERARLEKAVHGSRPADDALHLTIRILNKVYDECAADPHTPGTNIGDGSASDLTWRKSEMLDFFDAVLRPLGVAKSREALYQAWRRATSPGCKVRVGRLARKRREWLGQFPT